MNVEEGMVNGKESVCVCASCRACHSARVGVFGLVWHYILFVEPTSTDRQARVRVRVRLRAQAYQQCESFEGRGGYCDKFSAQCSMFSAFVQCQCLFNAQLPTFVTFIWVASLLFSDTKFFDWRGANRATVVRLGTAALPLPIAFRGDGSAW